MIKIWIVGSSGQIGTAINEVLDPLEVEVFNKMCIRDRTEIRWPSGRISPRP